MTQLSDRQKQILIGTLLGDGCLERNKQNFRLRIDHGEKQEDYVRWKHRELDGFVNGEPRFIRAYDKRTSKTYGHWRFNSKTSEVFTHFNGLFYKGRRKVVPSSIDALLTTPLALAVWFMDDGYNRKDCLGKYFNTQAYTIEEQNILRRCLERNFGLSTKIHWAAGRPRLYIKAFQSALFVKTVKIHILHSLEYKILNPVTTGTPR